jgi:hypothetical protein
MGKAARAVGRGLRGTGHAAAVPARAAWNANKRRRAANKEAGLPPWRRTRGGWGWVRKFVRRKLMGHGEGGETPNATETAAKTKRRTGDKVDRPDEALKPTTGRRDVPKPAPSDGRPAMAAQNNGPQGPQPTSPFWHACRQVHATAAQHKPQGMLARRQEAFEMSFSLAEISAALRLLAQTHTSQEPLEPAYAGAVMQVAATVEAAAQAAKQLGPSFDGLHATQVQGLLQPKPGQEKWDTVNNRP